MKTSRLGGALSATVVLLACGYAFAQPREPNQDTSVLARPLRSDYVKQWYIYNDDNLDGILNPGDTKIATFKNWWTTVSSGTQHNYARGDYNGDGTGYYANGEHFSSQPFNFTGFPGSISNEYWLPVQRNALSFYLTYSQRDNNDPNTFFGNYAPSDMKTSEIESHRERQGYAMGWVTNGILRDSSGRLVDDQTPAGKVDMSVMVHNGQSAPGGDIIPNWGVSQSNPQVSLSNHIDPRAFYDGDGAGPIPGNYGPPTFNAATGTYDPNLLANAAYMGMRGLSTGDLAAIANSMEVREYTPNGLPAPAWLTRTPSQISDPNGPKNHDGNTYFYQDAFLNQGQYVNGASAGGVIAGLCGLSQYNPEANNWGDQQVIRIDISPDMLKSGDPNTKGNINAIYFYDFGDSIPGAGGTQQTGPRVIAFNVDPNGMVYYLPDSNDPGNRIYFPENRIYIAEVTMGQVPEPMTALLVGAGGLAMLTRRRWFRRNA
jgi:hypothetical protein